MHKISDVHKAQKSFITDVILTLCILYYVKGGKLTALLWSNPEKWEIVKKY